MCTWILCDTCRLHHDTRHVRDARCGFLQPDTDNLTFLYEFLSWSLCNTEGKKAEMQWANMDDLIRCIVLNSKLFPSSPKHTLRVTTVSSSSEFQKTTPTPATTCVALQSCSSSTSSTRRQHWCSSSSSSLFIGSRQTATLKVHPTTYCVNAALVESTKAVWASYH